LRRRYCPGPVAAGGNNQIDAKRGNSVFVFALQ